MATPNCANEAAGIANITTASNRKRMLRILNLPCQIILRLPGSTLGAAGCVE